MLNVPIFFIYRNSGFPPQTNRRLHYVYYGFPLLYYLFNLLSALCGMVFFVCVMYEKINIINFMKRNVVWGKEDGWEQVSSQFTAGPCQHPWWIRIFKHVGAGTVWTSALGVRRSGVREATPSWAEKNKHFGVWAKGLDQHWSWMIVGKIGYVDRIYNKSQFFQAVKYQQGKWMWIHNEMLHLEFDLHSHNRNLPTIMKCSSGLHRSVFFFPPVTKHLIGHFRWC